ncbi:MAG: NAD-glutamate dehydrogenase domain-containing protein, partial [Pseudomonadota bacterium]|nr:NAD-glutamate dehydrogenase domain-containing protein [Pseudomonadota bacterium]
GLMKAQMVKNAVIVPVGSKGGFVVKRPPADRAARQAAGVAAYQTFIRGLLDLTDNWVDGAAVGPPRTLRHDDDDPYLVVAADKGTASFSDIANAVAAEYDFWLGDGFASGGSVGYDHKKMAITARGAWESVKRHFRERGHDIQSQDFTVVGCGDMSGDVFGNGMLLSRHIRLVAAFNHQHIFIDPTPDAATGWRERQRLFELPGSSWADYDAALISSGGGVFERAAKAIDLSPEIRAALGLEATRLTPAEVITAILAAEVDLLWFGGIGTYVRGDAESDAAVGDRANDGVRVGASQVRAQVIGEGANLGVTQQGRVDFARAGGGINTDAIDNSAGVDCSDHEVNIKILLGAAVAAGDLTAIQRDRLLADMTDEVADLVLRDNYDQTQALTLMADAAAARLDDHQALIRALERGPLKLDRRLEGLPDEEEMAARRAAGAGLTRPELAVL